jgi:hypothetical protein
VGREGEVDEVMSSSRLDRSGSDPGLGREAGLREQGEQICPHQQMLSLGTCRWVRKSLYKFSSDSFYFLNEIGSKKVRKERCWKFE